MKMKKHNAIILLLTCLVAGPLKGFETKSDFPKIQPGFSDPKPSIPTDPEIQQLELIETTNKRLNKELAQFKKQIEQALQDIGKNKAEIKKLTKELDEILENSFAGPAGKTPSTSKMRQYAEETRYKFLKASFSFLKHNESTS